MIAEFVLSYKNRRDRRFNEVTRRRRYVDDRPILVSIRLIPHPSSQVESEASRGKVG